MGSTWTEKKLQILEKYLKAYLKVFQDNTWYKLGYIDAFAGEGSIQIKSKSDQADLFEKDLDAKYLIKGSVERALAIDPGFDKYIFIEKNKKSIQHLKELCKKYDHKSVEIKNKDCNEVLCDLCQRDWSAHRAVVFLDPTGMQVNWETMEALASTKAVDVWIWFPLGVAVTRLLKRDGNLNPTWVAALNRIFGTNDWEKHFYENRATHPDLFQDKPALVRQRVADFKVIADYFAKRLSGIFHHVSDNPAIMKNSKGNPIYLMYFAAANEKGGQIAKRIADSLLKNVQR